MKIFTRARVFRTAKNEGLLVVFGSRVLIELGFVFPVFFPSIPFPRSFFSLSPASTRFLLSQAKKVKIGNEATRAGLFAGPK